MSSVESMINRGRRLDFENGLEQFIGGQIYRSLRPVSLREILQIRKLGPLDLYVHIPSCEKICAFCGFEARVLNEQQREIYVQALIDQINNNLSVFDQSKQIGKSVYFGGGTPGLLTVEQVERILGAMKNYIDIEEAEITFEMHPADITEEYIEQLIGLGINRFSVGVQNLSADERRTLRRDLTSPETDLDKLRILNCLGVRFNVDLIYGTPGQTTQSWSETYRQIIEEIYPEDITFYQYINAAGAQTRKMIVNGRISRPDVFMRHQMYKEAVDFALSHGYHLTSTCSFRRIAQVRQHLNMRSNFIGFGSLAYSRIGGLFLINTATTEDFIGRNERTNEYKGFCLPQEANFIANIIQQVSDKVPAEQKSLTYIQYWKPEIDTFAYSLLYYLQERMRQDQRKRLRDSVKFAKN